jgi:hypothetical protein
MFPNVCSSVNVPSGAIVRDRKSTMAEISGRSERETAPDKLLSRSSPRAISESE